MTEDEINKIKKEAIRENAIKAGKARQASMTKDERSKLGKEGAKARWEREM